MSINQPGLPPAGWFPDPTGAPLQRWWDGQSWTAHERPVEAPPVSPSAPLASVPAVVEPTPVSPSSAISPASAVEPHAISAPRAEPAREFAPVAPQQAPMLAPVQNTPQQTPVAAPQPAVPAASVSHTQLPHRTPEQAQYQPQQVQQAVISPPAPHPQPQQRAVVSSFAPETPVQPMFPAPVSAVSVQSPTTAAFDFRFSSPDDLGVNGRSPAFQAAAVAAAAGIAVPAEPESAAVAEPSSSERISLRSDRRANAPSRGAAPTGWSTGSVWVLVFLPLLRVVFAGGALYSLVTLDVGFISAAAIAVVPHLIGVLLAVSDRRRLADKGFDRPASWAWSIVGEWLYLIMRSVATRREGAGGSMVVLLWLLVLVVAGGASYYYVTLTELPIVSLLIG